MPARDPERVRACGGDAGGSVAAGEIDFRSLQSFIIRETGWTVAEYRNQPMADVFDLIEHLNEQPPAYRILGWRYGLKPSDARAGSKAAETLKDQEIGEMSRALGAAAQPMPAHIRDMAKWAAEQSLRAQGTEKKP